jgi:hypothetical protein
MKWKKKKKEERPGEFNNQKDILFCFPFNKYALYYKNNFVIKGIT